MIALQNSLYIQSIILDSGENVSLSNSYTHKKYLHMPLGYR